VLFSSKQEAPASIGGGTFTSQKAISELKRGHIINGKEDE
jgi:hypothetical protein